MRWGSRHYRKNSPHKTSTQRSTSGENPYYIVGTIQQRGGQRVGAVVLLRSDGGIELGNHGSGCPVKLNRVWRGGVDRLGRMYAYFVVDRPQFWRSRLVPPGRPWVGRGGKNNKRESRGHRGGSGRKDILPKCQPHCAITPLLWNSIHTSKVCRTVIE